MLRNCIRFMSTQRSGHIISLSSHKELALKISENTGYRLTQIKDVGFANSETRLNPRPIPLFCNQSYFVVQSPHINVNDQIMELLLTIQSCKQLSHNHVTAVIPCFPYSRADKTESMNLPIAAKLVAQLLEAAGVDTVITLDLHSPQIEGFFNVPVVNIQSNNLFSRYLKGRNNTVLVAPDAGAAKKVIKLSELAHLPFALIHKERTKFGEISQMTVVGDVANATAMIIDDMADSCGTVLKAANLLIEKGAIEVQAFMTHGILSGNAVKNIEESCITKFIVTNSLNQSINKSTKLEILDISEEISAVILQNSCTS